MSLNMRHKLSQLIDDGSLPETQPVDTLHIVEENQAGVVAFWQAHYNTNPH